MYNGLFDAIVPILSLLPCLETKEYILFRKKYWSTSKSQMKTGTFIKQILDFQRRAMFLTKGHTILFSLIIFKIWMEGHLTKLNGMCVEDNDGSLF
jgi:hypothetical protein